MVPFSAMTSVNLAYGLLAEGNYSAAVEQSRRAVELAPDLATADVMLSHAYRAASNTAESDAALARVESEMLKAHLSHCIESAIVSGDHAEQRQKASELIELLERAR